MQKILKHKKIIIASILIVIAFFIYSAYFKPSQDSGLVMVNNQTATQFAAGKEVLTLLIDLKSIKLDGNIFNNKIFKSLEDFSLPIDPEPKGRINPFAPIGVDLEVVDEVVDEAIEKVIE